MKQDTQRDGQATETGSLPPVVCPSALQELIKYIKYEFDWFLNNSPDLGVVPKILKKAEELLSTPLIEREAMEVKTDEEIEKMADVSSELQEGTYTLQHKVTYCHGFKDGFKGCLSSLSGAVEGNGWIDVPELPAEGEYVIGFFPDKTEGGRYVDKAIRSGNKIISAFPNSTAHCFEATKWQPLPAPPKK